MNYYNPYYGMYPYMMNYNAKESIFSRMFSNLKGINFNSILSGTQKTLNIVNQTIPLVRQASPIVKNAKTMFKVMNEFKKIDSPTNNKKKNSKVDSSNDEFKEIKENNGPTFFL